MQNAECRMQNGERRVEREIAVDSYSFIHRSNESG